MQLFAENQTEKIYIRKDSIFYEPLLKHKNNTHTLNLTVDDATIQVNHNLKLIFRILYLKDFWRKNTKREINS